MKKKSGKCARDKREKINIARVLVVCWKMSSFQAVENCVADYRVIRMFPLSRIQFSWVERQIFRPSFWITLFGQYFHGWTHCAKSANYSHSSIIFVFVRQPHIRVTSLFCAGFLDFCTAIRFCFWYLVSLHTTPSRNREIGRKSK